MGREARGLRWLFALVAVSILGDTALYTVLPVYAGELGISLWWVGIILSANRFVRLISNPIAAWLFERVGASTVFAVGLGLAVVTTATYGLTTHVAILLVARLLWGMTWSVLRLAGFEGVLRLAPSDERGQWMGKFRAAFRSGSLVAALLGGFLADTYGFSTPFIVFSLVMLISAIAGWFMLAEVFQPQLDQVSRAYPVTTATQTKMATQIETSVGVTGTVPSRQIVSVLGIGMLAAWVAEGLIPSTLGYLIFVRFGDEVSLLGLTLGAATFTGLLLSCRWAADVLLAPPTGRSADRIGVQRAGFLTYVTTGLVLAWLTIPAPAELFALAAFILLAALSAVITLAEVLAAHTASGQGQVRFMARYATAADLGSAFGPLGGYVLGMGIGITTVYSIAAVVLGGLGVGFQRLTSQPQNSNQATVHR